MTALPTRLAAGKLSFVAALLTALLSLVQAVGVTSAPQTLQQTHDLEPGKAVEREIAGGEAHSYRVALKEKEFLRAVTAPRGVDVVLALYGPDGGKLLEADFFKRPGPEPVSFEAERAGVYRLEVRAPGAASVKGRYALTSEVKAAATAPDLADYRYVHFATHGLLNSQHPELSGIALSMFDERGRPQDGFLRAHEVFNLKLAADLVVLSACQTGLGKEVRGEGLVGLTRGFMYAGAPRVVVSLWNVSDEATAELMARFYRGMLKDGLRPARALQAAQVSMLGEKRFASPYFWAAFTLQGEWR